MTSLFDARAWVVWLISAVIITLLTRNPLYAILLLLIAQSVRSACGVVAATIPFRLGRVAVVIITLSVLLNGLSVHIGETVLMRLPASWPLIGGPITLEAMVYGAINGLLLVVLLALFMAFQSAVPVSELVRLTPRAFHHLGLVVLIGLTYVPETLSQLQRVREAQAVRGHTLKGIGDWQPIVLPLLIGGLERSMNLAEAMVARGFGATEDRGQEMRVQLVLVAALLLVLGGWALAMWQGWLGWMAAALGVVLLLVLVWRLGKRHPATRYRARHLTRWDWLVMASAVIPLLFVWINVPGLGRDALFYAPYPTVTLPPFDPLLGVALLGLAMPAVIVVAQRPPNQTNAYD